MIRQERIIAQLLFAASPHCCVFLTKAWGLFTRHHQVERPSKQAFALDDIKTV